HYIFYNYLSYTYIYILSLHDALPISLFFQIIPMICWPQKTLTFNHSIRKPWCICSATQNRIIEALSMFYVNWMKCNQIIAMSIKDRKSTRLNSSHVKISYAVFCLKKK